MSLFAVPHFLPKDARGFADGISIFWMLRELSTVPCKRPRFHVMLCLGDEAENQVVRSNKQGARLNTQHILYIVLYICIRRVKSSFT